VESIDILGSRLDLASRDEIFEWLQSRLSTPTDGQCRHVVTLNPEYVMAARRDPSFARAIHDGALVIPDGVGVVVAARIIHGKRIGRTTGVDLIEELAHQGAPLFLLGAAPGVAAHAAARLQKRCAETNVVGVWSEGTSDTRHDRETLEHIEGTGAGVLLVAYGAPNQVHYIHRNQTALAETGVRIAVGVGGAFDYIAGAARRPPSIVRRLGLEWLFRLVQEPHRWRRQLVLPVFLMLVVREAICVRIRTFRKSHR
jgi:N-acetylglucosaminyldiphosphoundecaprenol N-acetyl-beta-D-mannosaminyltransferase